MKRDIVPRLLAQPLHASRDVERVPLCGPADRSYSLSLLAGRLLRERLR